MKNKAKLIFGGFLTGIINSLFGAGGGLIAVSMLNKSGLNQKKSQATAVCIILPLTVITCVLYYFQGNLDISSSWKYIIPGVVGALPGCFLLEKLPDKVLRKIFAGFMLFVGVRMVMK